MYTYCIIRAKYNTLSNDFNRQKVSLDVLINFFLIKKTECKGHLQNNIIQDLIPTESQPNLI